MSTRRALLITYLDRYASIIVGFVASVLIARLLTPVEVGIFSVAMVLVGFLSPFRDFGASQYVIQCKELNDEILGTTRTIQFILGVMLAFAIVLASPWVAKFYGEPQINNIMLLLALNSLLLPVGTLSMALLNREVRFKELALVRLSGAIVGASTSVLLAWNGHGPISLAYGALLGALATALSANYFRPVRIPWNLRLEKARYIFKFGGAFTGITLLGMIRSSIAELSLGRLQGLAVSGLFGRAQGLITMIQSLLMDGAYSAALPLFSRALRENKPLGPIYLQAMSLISALGWTVFGLLALIVSPLIYLLYGEQWIGSAPVAQSLCIALLFGIPNLLSQAPLIALGKVNIVLAYVAIATLLQIGFVVFASQYSLSAVGLAIVFVSMLLVVPFLAISKHVLGFSWRQLGKTLLQSAIVASASLLVPVLIYVKYGDRVDDAFVRIMLSSASCGIGFVIIANVIKHPISVEINILVSSVVGALKRFK